MVVRDWDAAEAPQESGEMAAWRQKYGTIVKVICPLLVIFGALQLIGVLK